MKFRKMISSRMAKITFVALCVLVVKFRHVIADHNAWFKQNIQLQDVKAALNDYGDEIDVTNKEGMTGLMYATNLGYQSIADEFIKRGASLDIKAKNDKESHAPGMKVDERIYGDTALHFAILNSDDNNSFAIAKDLVNGVKENGKLVSRKANLFITNEAGYTPLHMVEGSVENPDRRFQEVEMLMSAVGNQEVQEGYLNAQNNEGNTILHIMAQKNDMLLIAKIVNKYGRMLKLNITNKAGKTPSVLARESGYGYCAYRLDELLKKYNDKSISDDDYKKINFNEIYVPSSTAS